jgi:hypothetical protein
MSDVPRCAQCQRPESEHDNGKCPKVISGPPAVSMTGIVQILARSPEPLTYWRAGAGGYTLHVKCLLCNDENSRNARYYEISEVGVQHADLCPWRLAREASGKLRGAES